MAGDFNTTAGIHCGICGTVYPALMGLIHQCGPVGTGARPEAVDYERVRTIVREEIALALKAREDSHA